MTRQTDATELTNRLVGFGFTVEKINNVFNENLRFIVKNKADWLTGQLLKIPTKWELESVDALAAFVDELVEDRKFFKQNQ